MSLRRRLGRLPPQPVKVQATAPEVNANAMAELRERMQQILSSGREQPTSPEPRPVLSDEERLAELPIAIEQNHVGRFWLRRKRLPIAERVGRWELRDAENADAERLSLLSLDAALSSLDLSRALYFDTETTGLGGGAGTYAFLIGLGFFEDGRLTVEQVFLAGPEQETAALAHVAKRIEAAESLVSYNGKAFDWPLLKGRLVMNRLPRLPDKPHLDLLHLARRVHKERLMRCALTTLEREVLGFERVGDIPGAEVCARYLHYLRGGEPELLRAVIEHNYWDVVSMTALVGLYGQAEPALLPEDYVGLARTLRRAKNLDAARRAAEIAVSGGGGERALRARAEVSKALGERLLALRDFEQCHALDSSPTVRLELAKLYEHFSKDPERALQIAQAGTLETTGGGLRRIQRLERKVARRGPSGS